THEPVVHPAAALGMGPQVEEQLVSEPCPGGQVFYHSPGRRDGTCPPRHQAPQLSACWMLGHHGLPSVELDLSKVVSGVVALGLGLPTVDLVSGEAGAPEEPWGC